MSRGVGRVLVAGLLGSGAVAALWALLGTRQDGLGAGTAGLLATAAQALAHWWMAGVPAGAPASAMWRRHLHGTALRTGAAAAVIGLVVQDRNAFPPLATVLGFAGVLLGLMALEIRNRA